MNSNGDRAEFSEEFFGITSGESRFMGEVRWLLCSAVEILAEFLREGMETEQ